MRVCVIAFALVSVASRAPAPRLDQPVTSSGEDEIIVRGQRSERYRIPPALRTLPPERSERWRNTVDRDLGCQHVGPRGYGTPLLPIFTISGEGKISIGQKKSAAE